MSTNKRIALPISTLLFFLCALYAYIFSLVDDNDSRSLDEKTKKFPVVVFYEASCGEDEDAEFCNQHRLHLDIPSMPFFDSSAVASKWMRNSDGGQCVDMAEWHKFSFPNCNNIHEIAIGMDDEVTFLGKGERRYVFKVQKKNYGTGIEESFVFKTLRNGKAEFNTKTLEANRIDAIVSERLVHSPYVADIYGFCAQSVLNEMATTTLHDYIIHAQLSWTQKLRLATDAAKAFSDLHGIDDPTGQWVSLSHGDVRPWNFLITKDYRLMIHDFNAAMLFLWNVESNSMCEHAPTQNHCRSNCSPEECVTHYKLSEQMGAKGDFYFSAKKDVYELGNILYYILTGRFPYNYPKHINRVEGGKLVLNGILPVLPPDIVELGNQGEKAITAILSAMGKCYRFMPRDRPSAHVVADELALALRDIDG